MSEKIKVMVIVPNKTGVGYFRSIKPHLYLDEFYSGKFEITMTESFDFNDSSFGKDQNIIHFHNTVGGDYELWYRKMKELQASGVKLVIDLDDMWVLPKNSSYYQIYKDKISGFLKRNIEQADFVTTTTPIFAKEISKLNKNVIVLANAIDNRESQFQPSPSANEDRLRVGIICGSSHEADLELLRGVTNMLKPEMDKIQFVLCGFDLNGNITEVNQQTGERTERPIKPHESIWTKYEEILTDKYSIIPQEYKNYLMSFNSMLEYPHVDKMPYKRCWTKNVNIYGTHFKEIDVLLVPLVKNEFNSKKSVLKLVEAGSCNKAVIVSNVEPYTLDIKSYIEKGGIINKEGNCIAIKEGLNARDWAKAIKFLLNNKEDRQQIANNLTSLYNEKYELGVVTKTRAEFYEKLIK